MMDIDIIDEETLNTNIEDEEVLELDVTVEDNTEDISTTLSNDFLKGEKGDKGDKGDTYTITSSDYQEIANVVETDIQPTLSNKVDKVTGKGLSTNDFTTEEKSKLSSLENYDDTEVRQLIDEKQPRGNYLTEETDPTVPNYVKSITQQNIITWNNKADMSDIPDVSNFASKTELGSETTARENADIGLQEQIDAITSSSDVKDIVGTYIELQNYDTSTLGNDDIVKVLQDNTHNKAMTYYRWVILGSTGSWQYVGQEGPYYTKSETETLLNNKQDEITSSNKIDSDLVNDTNQTNKFVTQIEKTTWNTEIENLHEEDELLKRNLQTTTGSGEEVTLNKTTELDFVKPPLPMGNSEQESTEGKNLLNVSLLPITSHGITISKDDSGNIVLNGTPDYNSGYEGFIIGNTQTIDAGTYAVSVANKKEGIGLTIGGFKGQINLTMSDTVKTKTGTTNESVSLRPTLNIRYDVGTLNNFILNPQLEQSSTATSYEPYTGGTASPNPDYPQEIRNVTGNVEVTISNENNTESKTLTASLGNIELCKIGDYQDYFYKASNKWYLHNEIKKILLNGTESWSISNKVFYLASISDYINSSGKICLSDKYTAINNTNVGTSAITQNNSICFFITNTNPRLYIRDERFNNVNDFKAELSENNVKVYYPTATPTDTEITDATLISQLEEISKTLSYQGQTNITSNTIAMFDVEAYQDLKIILDEKYVKPGTGIPKTDLESSVQTSLGKADTALQSHQDISGKADKTALQDISINTNSPMPSFDDMEVLDTYEFDISDTNYHPIYTLPNNGLNYIDTDITVAYRLTVTGTNISEVADIIDVWHNPISYPLTTVLNRTLSTSAATSGVRYLRAVYPTSAYLNDTTYPLGQEIASYNATARHIKIEVFKQPSNITWKSASENSIYINTTYNGSSSVTLYTTRGWIFRNPQSFVASSAGYANYVNTYECAIIGPAAIKSGNAALAANHFVYLADDGLVYDISNTTKNISANYKKVGVLSTAVAKNTTIPSTYFKTVFQLSSTIIRTISHDTFALGRRVFLRCTMDANGNIHSDNYLATSMGAGYTWLPFGVATDSNAINMDTRGQHFYSLDENGDLTHIDGRQIASQGESSGTSDYSQLSNKPSINNVTLNGNQTLSELGIQALETGKDLSTNDFTNTYKNNVDSNTIARHSHSNKSVLDNISSTDISNWNAKAETGDIPSNSSIVNLIYPIGSIYIAVNNTNPSSLFGGNWEQLKDRFLLGAGDIYTAGDTGGEATHQLTYNEMPSHTHGMRVSVNGATGGGARVILQAKGVTNNDADIGAGDTLGAGNNWAHNNMPPYLTVYMWKRTA